MKKSIFLFILIILMSACGVPMGNRIDSHNLSVYYLDGITKEKAIAFAKYWRDNGFVGENKQTIQLDSENNVIFVKLIEREVYSDEPISIDEEVMLQDLERTLKQEIFNKEVTIVITDNTFQPIMKRNI
ncbi:MAG: hypothetical protein M9897_11170 [Brumimicrobium sp.]|nr:hypothetical protein [Brumimicrobium sp.]